MTGIPVVDAAYNGRAHPAGVIGSMGLARNPVTAAYVRENEAPGAISLASELGR